MLLKNSLAEPRISCQSFSEILRISKRTDILCSISRRTTNPEKEKLENRRLSFQSFLEMLRISEKVWYETHQYFNGLPKIKEKSKKPEVVPIQAALNPYKPKNDRKTLIRQFL